MVLSDRNARRPTVVVPSSDPVMPTVLTSHTERQRDTLTLGGDACCESNYRFARPLPFAPFLPFAPALGDLVAASTSMISDALARARLMPSAMNFSPSGFLTSSASSEPPRTGAKYTLCSPVLRPLALAPLASAALPVVPAGVAGA